MKYTTFEGFPLEGGDLQYFKAENMTVIYGGHGMSGVRKNDEGFLFVTVFNVKVQVHQCGSGLERPEYHVLFYRPIRGSCLETETPEKGIGSQGTWEGRTAPSSFHESFRCRLDKASIALEKSVTAGVSSPFVSRLLSDGISQI